jgi:hypothetical protein
MAVVQNGFAKMHENYKAHYEDVIAYFLRYPEVMFEGNMTLPIFPEDFNDSYGFYVAEKGKYETESTNTPTTPTAPAAPTTPNAPTALPTTPLSTPTPRNFNRGPDVGYQNLFIENYEPASDALIPTYGPLRLVELVPKLLAMKESKSKPGFRPPFIRISLKSLAMANKLHIIGSEDRTVHPTTQTQKDKNIYNVQPQDIVDQIALKLNISGYVPLGDILFARNVSHQISTFNTSSGTPKHFPFAVFAHRDICTSVPVNIPPVSFSDTNHLVKGYRANMFHESVTMDIRAMYADVGYTLNSAYKYVVMRCFLSQEITENIDRKFDFNGFIKAGCQTKIVPTFKSKNAFEMRTYNSYDIKGDAKYYGTNIAKYYGSKYGSVYIDVNPQFIYMSQSNNVININENVIFKFLPSPEAAILNLADVITENSTEVNRIFQGVSSKINDVVQKVDSVAYMFAKQLCAVRTLDIEGYPDLCACIGQGRLAEIRLLLKNSAYRPQCHDGKCLDVTDKKVFRLKYNPMPCNKTSICSNNVTFDAETLNLKNVNFTCKFKQEELDESNILSPVTALGPGIPTRRFVWFVFAGLCIFLFIAALLLK